MNNIKVLKFSASWCAPCTMLSKVIASTETDILFEEIDIDENQQYAQQLGIRGVPTLIMVDAESKEIKRISGMMSIPDLKEWLANS
jgi:thioredoxin-like negative regulator of GroEL